MWEEIELLKDHPRLLPDIPDVTAVLACGFPGLDLHPVDLDGPCRGLLQEVQAAQKGALATAGRPYDDDNFAKADIEIDALDDVQWAEIFVQAPDFDHFFSHV
jgi:hypothetical protein